MNWKQHGGELSYLQTTHFRVPYISLPGKEINGIKNKTVFITAGMHLEETSGPNLLHTPNPLIKILEPHRELGTSFLLFPQINQFSTRFAQVSIAKRCDRFLRYDHRGVDFNDGFGLENQSRITAESKAVEEVMREYIKSHNVPIGISLHEDSDVPGKGYIWTNGVPEEARSKFRQSFESLWGGTRFILEPQSHPSVPEESSEQGKWEGLLAVDFEDEGCLEHWWAKQCGIAAFCLEAPYGAHPKIKELFLLDAIRTVLNLK